MALSGGEVDIEAAPPSASELAPAAPPVARDPASAMAERGIARRRGWMLPPALRVPAFRWYWASQWPVLLGTWMQVVALGYLVYNLTHSQTAVGVVAAADGLPAVALSMVGGTLADRHPRRRILLVTQPALALSAGCLAVLVWSGHASLWSIVVIAVCFGSADAIDLPTRQALVADLVDRELVVGAMALGSMAMSATRVIAPSLGGLLISVAGPSVCFGVLAVAYTAPVLVLLWAVPDLPPQRTGSRALADLRRGLSDAWHDPLVRALVASATTLALLGVSYMPYLPVLARSQLGGDARVLGLLYSTGGVGGLVAGAILASAGRSSMRVRMLLGGGVVYAAALFTLAHSHTLAVALPALVGISFGFLAMNTSMTTLLQTETDPAARGRMLGVYATVFAGLQPLGTLVYGGISRVVPLFDAIGVGALVVGAVAVWAATRPALRHLEG